MYPTTQKKGIYIDNLNRVHHQQVHGPNFDVRALNKHLSFVLPWILCSYMIHTKHTMNKHMMRELMMLKVSY